MVGKVLVARSEVAGTLISSTRSRHSRPCGQSNKGKGRSLHSRAPLAMVLLLSLPSTSRASNRRWEGLCPPLLCPRTHWLSLRLQVSAGKGLLSMYSVFSALAWSRGASGRTCRL